MAPQSSEPEIASDEIKQKYSEILKANGILDEVSKVWTHEPAFLKGEHMGSAPLYVKIEFKDVEKKPKNLFVKDFVDNPAFVAMVKEMRVMEKESCFFQKFIPEAKEFCKKYPGCEKLMDLFPKSLYADEEMIVLENVVVDDTFVLLKRDDFQDLHTAKFVLTNLAKFHATTFSMIKSMGHEEFRSKYDQLVFESWLSDKIAFATQMLDNGIQTCINILKGNCIEGSSDTIQKLSGFLGKSFSIAKDLAKFRPDEKLNVLTHGDAHGNNMLFKTDPETGKVTNHLLIDLQEFIDDYKKNSTLGFFYNLYFISFFGASKDVDYSSMPDNANPEALAEFYQDVIANWVKRNPEKAAEIATEIVAFVNEHLEFSK